MTSQAANHTDLTRTEEPTERAIVHLQPEKIGIKAKVLGGNAIELEGESHPGSPQSTAITAFLLVVGCCIVAGTAAAIGAPPLVALITGLCTPLITYALVRVIPGRQGR